MSKKIDFWESNRRFKPTNNSHLQEIRGSVSGLFKDAKRELVKM